MANVIQIKRKTTTGAPALGDLAVGEFCLVTPDDVLYLKKDAGTLLSYPQASALLNSPAFTGVPTAPTAAGGNNSTQIATTAFVQAAVGAAGGGDMLVATYDPTGVGADAFSMDNMVEGTSLILTAAERAAITANTAKPDQASITAEVGAAIDALIGGAPGALNTLNELAAAMADDAAFSATVTASLALKLDANSTIDGGTIS